MSKDKLNEGFLENLDFWMHSIYTFTSASQETQTTGQLNQLSPPILIVGTHRHSLAETAAEQNKKVCSYRYISLFAYIICGRFVNNLSFWA